MDGVVELNAANGGGDRDAVISTMSLSSAPDSVGHRYICVLFAKHVGVLHQQQSM